MIHCAYYKNQADFFDIEGILRARRLDWVGKTLRTTIPSLAREVLVSRAESNLATKQCQKGSIMMDVPSHTTMHQLMALAEDKRATPSEPSCRVWLKSAGPARGAAPSFPSSLNSSH